MPVTSVPMGRAYHIHGYTLACLSDPVHGDEVVKVTGGPKGSGGEGENMFALTRVNGDIVGLPDFHYWVGTQRFTGFVTGMIEVFADLTMIGLDDGRILTVETAAGPGGTGQCMFAVTESTEGFNPVDPGRYPYWRGSYKFRAGIVGLYKTEHDIYIALYNGNLLRTVGCGRSGPNMLRIEEKPDGSITPLQDSGLLGTQQFRARVRCLLDTGDGKMLVGLSDGWILKVSGNPSGQYMFGVKQNATGFERTGGTCYVVGSIKFHAGIAGLYKVSDELFVTLEDGFLVKLDGAGEADGDNMWNIRDEGGTIEHLPGLPEWRKYWQGTQKFSARVVGLVNADGFTLVGLADGRVLKVKGPKGTGGYDWNMFAVTESPTGFERFEPLNYDYYVGDYMFHRGIKDLHYLNGELFISLESATLIKIEGTGYHDHNLFNLDESGWTIKHLPPFTKCWLGTQ